MVTWKGLTWKSGSLCYPYRFIYLRGLVQLSLAGICPSSHRGHCRRVLPRELNRECDLVFAVHGEPPGVAIAWSGFGDFHTLTLVYFPLASLMGWKES